MGITTPRAQERARPSRPEGSELDWDTVAAISRFKKGHYKAEQLILLPTHTGFIRQLFVNRPLEEWAENNLTAHVRHR